MSQNRHHRRPSSLFHARLLAAAVAGFGLFTASAPAATLIWDGGAADLNLSTALNWDLDVAPNVNGDILQWNGTVAGDLSLIFGTGLTGGAGNAGITLDVTAAQTGNLLLDGGTNTTNTRVNNITIAAGAGAFTLGDGTGTTGLLLGGAAGTRTFTNNSLFTATIGSDVLMASGGGGASNLLFTGTGNWQVNGNLNSNNNGNNNSVTKNGTGTLTIAGVSNYVGATTVNSGVVNVLNTGGIGSGNLILAGGVTNFAGTTAASTANGGFKVGSVANSAAVLNILPGASMSRNNLWVGDAGAGTGGGAVYQSGGTLTLTQAAGIDNLRLGSNAGGYGYYSLSGGTLTANEMGIGASSADTVGVMEVSGGAAVSNGWITLGRGTGNSAGLLNVSGGTVNATRLDMNWGTSTSAQAVVNIVGGRMTVTGNGVNLANASTVSGVMGIVNLVSGTLTTTNVQAGQANQTALLNFNGGTLRAHTTNSGANFINSANIDAINVYANGGTIDNNGTAITITNALVAPAGQGVTAPSVAVPSGGAGYVGAPLVRLTGGSGTGATGYATISNGVVTGIVITNPGTGYAAGDSLTATFSGGGYTSPAAPVIGVPVSALASGGMTFVGPGTTTLAGTNTYAGPTNILSGRLALAGSGAVNASSAIVVNGTSATFTQNSSVPVSQAVTLTSGTVDGTGTINLINVAGGAGNTVANLGGGTLTVGSLNFAGAGAFHVRSGGTEGIVIGNLTTAGGSGSITVNASSTTGTWANGITNLVGIGSPAGWTFSDFTLGTVAGLTARQSRSLVLNGNYLALTVSGDAPKWTGLDNGNWVVGATGAQGNWKLIAAGTSTDYIDGDAVLFDDSAAGTTDVTIGATVSPFSVTVDNSLKNYSFTGAAGIAGSASLVKSGTGTLTLATVNTFTGNTTLNGGRVNLNSTSPIGSGTLTINGGTLDNTSGGALVNTGNNVQVWNADFTFVGTGSFDLGTGAVAVPGTGVDRTVTVSSGKLSVGEIKAGGINFTKQGAGTLALSSTGASTAGTVFGNLNVAAGTIQINRDGTDATNSGDLVTSSLSGSGAISNGAGVARWLIVNGSASSTTFAGSLINGGAGGLGLSKQGAGSLTLAGTSNYSDVTTVDGGLLVINGSNTGPGTNTTVNNGSRLFLNASSSLGAAGNVTVNSGTVVLGNPTALGNGVQIRLNGTTNTSTLVYATDGGDNVYQLSFGTTTIATIVADRATPGAGVNHTMTTTPAGGMGGGTITFTSGANVTSGQGRMTFNQFGLGAGSVQTTLLNPTSANLTLGDVFKVNNNVTQTLGLGGTTQDNLVTGIIYNGTALTGTNVLNLLKADASSWTLTQNNTYTGTTTVSGGTLTVGTGGNTGSLGTGAVTNNASLIYNRNDTFAVPNAFSGAGTLTQAGTGTLTFTGANTSTGPILINSGAIQVGDGNTTGSLGTGPVTNNGNLLFNRSDAFTASNAISGPGGVQLVSSGTVILSGASTYTGPTSISAGGTLSVTGSIASPVTVTYGGLDGTGSVGATTMANSSLGFIGNGNGTGTGALTLSSLTFEGESKASIRAGGGTAAGIVVTGALVTTPVNGQVVIDAYSPAWVSGLNNLISFGSFAGSISDFTLGTVTGANGRVTPSGLVLNGNNIALNMTVDAPKWTGLDNNQWTIGPTGANGNWKLIGSGAKTDYMEGDTVLFDDTANTTTVDLATYVNPSAMTFNNSTKNYILQSGVGYEVSGTASLTKNGTGTLTITNTNTYSGGTTLNAGRLNVNTHAAIGTGTLTLNGGTLGNTTAAAIVYAHIIPQTWGGDFTFAGPSDLDLGTGAVTITGTGVDRVVSVTGTLAVGEIKGPGVGLVKQGTGTLVLSSTGANTAASVIGGVLNVAGGTIQINRTGTDAANSGDLTAGGLTGTGTITNGAAVARWFFVNSSSSHTFDGVLINGGTGGLGLNKQGIGSLTLTNVNTYTDVTTVDNGTLNFTGVGSIANSSSYVLNNAAVLVADTQARLNAAAPISITGFASRLEISGDITLGGNISLAQRGQPVDVLPLGEHIRSTGNNTLTGNINVTTGGSQARIQSDAGKLTLTGNITTDSTTGRNLYLQGAGDGEVTGIISGNASNPAGNITLHKWGTGTWTLSGNNSYTGGTNIAGGVLAIPSSTLSSGQVAITDATLRATGNASVPGAVTLAGTTAGFDVAAGVTLTLASTTTGTSLTKVGTGTLVLAGAASLTGTTTVSAGKISFSPGSHSVAAVTGQAGTVVAEPGASVTSGGVTLDTLQVDGRYVLRNSTSPSASMVNSLVIGGTAGAWTGKFDLTNNALVINAASAGDQTTVVARVQDQVTSGRAGGTWAGNGITSSTMTDSTFAAAHSLAIVDAGELNLTTFRDLTGLNANSTIVAIAHNGDATLDGKVDAFDLNKLAANWQQSGKSWASGDFTQDGKVDAFDLNLLAANWQFGAAGSLEAALAEFPVFGSAVAAVPEPASLAILAIGGAALLGRRRRK